MCLPVAPLRDLTACDSKNSAENGQNDVSSYDVFCMDVTNVKASYEDVVILEKGLHGRDESQVLSDAVEVFCNDMRNDE